MDKTKALRIVVFVLVAALGVAIGLYVYYQKQFMQGKASWLFPEKATPVVFTPAPSVLAERAKFVIQQKIGADWVSTTLPVSTSMVEVPLQTMPVEVEETELEKQIDIQTGHMHGTVTTATTNGAYLIKQENSQLCDSDGACPITLFAKKAGSDEPDTVIFSTTAKRVWFGNIKRNGNPDLFVDYGKPNMPPVRLYWDEDGEYPSYTAYPPSGEKKLPAFEGAQ
jgi:hypothetical protein